MAEGLISAAADDLLDSLVGTYKYIQLHDGAPGAAGTSNVADETDRVQATWAAATGGAVTTSADMTWEGVTVTSGTQDYTHFSAWDAATSGNCGFTGTITANEVASGDDFRISAGSISASFTTAS